MCNNSQAILFEILAGKEPDGRPLWAYGFDYARLAKRRHSLLTKPESELTGWDIRLLVPCLSETLRREHGGGAWSWHTASEMLGISLPLRKRIGKSLRAYWRRPIRRGLGEQALLLASLVREGGIPNGCSAATT